MMSTHDKALPFEPLVPNETTIEAMTELETGKGKRFDSVEALMADLDAEDEYDLKAYEEAMAEFKKNPVTYSHEEVWSELGDLQK